MLAMLVIGMVLLLMVNVGSAQIIAVEQAAPEPSVSKWLYILAVLSPAFYLWTKYFNKKPPKGT